MTVLRLKNQIVLLSVVSTLLALTTVCAATGQDYFKAGIQASTQGNDADALQQFMKAEKMGLSTPSLKYNMAVSYYRLQQYESARKIFLKLTDVPAFEQVAYFNLGLVANKQKDERAAIRWFQRAYRDVSNKKIRRLAEVALKRLGVSAKKTWRFDPTWTGFISSSLAHDSNVALVNDSLLGVTNQSDTVVDLTASAGRWLKGGISHGVRMLLGANLQRYSKLSQNDYSQLSARVLRYDRLSDWKMRIGGSWDEIYFNGSEYQRIVSADVRGWKTLSKENRLQLRFKLSRIQATDALFDYLDGWRYQLRAGLQQRYGQDRVRYYYQLETNNRRDRSVGTVDPFISYSPMRHTLRATGWWGLSDKWRARLDARYRYSRYNDPNELAGSIFVRREDNQVRLSARVSRKLDRRWETDVQYIFTNNDSSIDRKSYDRSVVKAGVSWSF